MRITAPKFGVLYVQHTTHASYYDDWLDAFCEAGAEPYNIFRKSEGERLKADLGDLEGLVCLHSTTADNLYYLKSVSPILQSRRGRLVVFVGNEYNSAGGGMASKRSLLKELGAQVAASQLLQETCDWLYEGVCEKAVSVPHALNPKVFEAGPDFSSRRRDLGVRSFRYPGFLGDEERNGLLQQVTRMAAGDERVDISTTERLSREDWCDFLKDSVSTISTEAGSYFLEKDDTIVRALEERYREGGEISTDSLIYRVGQRLPSDMKRRIREWLSKTSGAPGYEGSWAEKIQFSDIEDEFFPEEKRCPFHSKIISARHLEAVGTGTIQILLEGRYNDLLKAGEHYLELRKDLKNLSELVDAVREPQQFEEMTRDTREMVMSSHTHRHRVQQVLGEVFA
ncbi:MAG: glycosyltransferase [Verrucomicrobiales bacterium]|nr:glycosyltransferase [Verrucomicrobiales bacterium]